MENKPLNILGVSHPYSWNNAACLLMDGNLVAFAEEERFTRIKYAPNTPAIKAIDYCLKEGGITMEDIDYICIGFDSVWSSIWGNLFIQSPRYSYHKIKKNFFSIRSGNRKLPFDVKDRRVIFVNHHDAHIASSFYLSGFESSNIISFDGAGGGEAGKIGYGSGTKIDIFKRISNEGSWGRMYEAVTGLLGFKPHGDEGKVMGLSSFGVSSGDFNFINYYLDIPEIDGYKFKQFLKTIRPRLKDEPLTDYHKNLAATLQANLEKVALRITKYLVRKTGNRNLCLSGEVALNCAMNGKLLQSGLIDNIFVQPISSDAGTALGAAVHVYVEKNKKRPDILFDNLYLGPKYTNDQIKTILDNFNLKYSYHEDIAKVGAELLSKNKIVGYFQGKMEAGPRALGGRSILANPANPSMKDLVNNKVKKREPWRPFAPSILEERASSYALNYYPSYFMILAFMSNPDKVKDIISATHVDGTIRVQGVSKKTNPNYWQLIKEFENLTGIPAVLNTSFNVAGEPIVCSPEDAIRTFFASGLDCLILENFLIVK